MHEIVSDNIRAAHAEQGGRDDWLSEVQERALADFERLGFPGKGLEQWKYTDISPLAAAYPDWLWTDSTAPRQLELPALDIADADQLVFIDGEYDAALSRVGALPEGAFLGSIGELAAQQPDACQHLFGRLAASGTSAFVALNAALAGNGAALLVPAGVKLARPVVLTYLSVTPRSSAQPRLLVDLAAGSAATVVEHFCSTGAAIINAVAELSCGPNSRLDYYKLQAEAPAAWHTAAQYAEVGRDAVLLTTHLDIGGALARNELQVRLVADGAHAETKGLFMADAERHVESRITVEHVAPHTTSRERYRGILGDKARGVFNGRIHVHAAAQKTAAELSNRNLLLNAGAEINTKPELEIYADDVKCAHGSTTGQLDQQSLFYLLTRGVDHATARSMLITAFAAELLADIAIPAIAERAQQALAALRSAGSTSETAA
jgi:Fe-S cluster assembly protein SufD